MHTKSHRSSRRARRRVDDVGAHRDCSARNARRSTSSIYWAPLAPSAETVAQLQTALRSACEQLQSLTEEHQTALEELRSANEELHSVNEEMQSTNEELETSKEELQSLNEELHTVNVRLSEKIDELDQTNSDLRNLFESTEIATVFLDRHLIIRSFTPAIATHLQPDSERSGRPLTDIVSHLQYRGLREDVNFVLSTLEPLERRVVRDDRLGALHHENPALSRARQHGKRSAGHVRRCDQHRASRGGAGRGGHSQGCFLGDLVA